MPYSPEHKKETRERILRSARHLFNRKGFVAVTLDEVMADSGLTHGGFYNHFNSKDELYAESIMQFARNDPPENWQTLGFDGTAEGERLARLIVNAYLSREHLEDRDGSCPMVGLPSDVARGGTRLKSAFQQVLEMMIGVFQAGLPYDEVPARERAITMVALCVGGMVLARAVEDETLSNDLRSAVLKAANAQFGDPSEPHANQIRAAARCSPRSDAT